MHDVIQPSDMYIPESGHQLVLFDFPPGLAADGDTFANVKFSVPANETGLHTIKWVSAGKVALFPNTPRHYEYYPPTEPAETDFAAITSEEYTFVVDLDGTECTSVARPVAPELVLSGPDWKINGVGTVAARLLPAGQPVAALMSTSELAFPVPLGTGGCKLRTNVFPLIALGGVADPLGDYRLVLPLPNDPAFVGTLTVWQVAGVDLLAGDILTTEVLKARIEP